MVRVRSVRSRNFVFTLNNPSFPGDYPSVFVGSKSDCPAKSCVWQLEKGDEGTVHIQGYCTFKDKKTFFALKKLNSRVHWEMRKGSDKQAYEYCTKAESRIAEGEEWGVRPNSKGKRSDLLVVRDKLKSGMKIDEIREEHFVTWCRNYRALGIYAADIAPKRTWHTYCTVFWGDSGAGKTQAILDAVGTKAYWLPKPESERCYWTNYKGEEDVVIDEFFGWIRRSTLCRLVDKTPFQVETKLGASVEFTSKRIWITSNDPPSRWWSKIGIGAMKRRLQGDLGVCYKITAPVVDGVKQYMTRSISGVGLESREEEVENNGFFHN